MGLSGEDTTVALAAAPIRRRLRKRGRALLTNTGYPFRPTQYQLEVGMYHLATMERLPVLDDSGTVRDDRILLGTLQLTGE